VDARGRAGNNHRSPTKPVFRRAFYCGLMMSDMGMGGMMHHHGMGPMKPAPAGSPKKQVSNQAGFRRAFYCGLVSAGAAGAGFIGPMPW